MKKATFYLTVMVLLLTSSCTTSDEVTDLDAMVQAEYYVTNRLKSPSSADFDYPIVTQMEDSTYIVRGNVDSQNGFGAMIRSSYKVKVTFLPKDKILFSEFQLR